MKHAAGRKRKARSKIVLVRTQTRGADGVEITLRNEGDTALVDFPSWDVIVEYLGIVNEGDNESTHNAGMLPGRQTMFSRRARHGRRAMKRLIYSRDSEPRGGQWVVKGKPRQEGGGKVVGTGVCYPGAEVTISLKLSPGASRGNYNLLTIITPDNTCVSTGFSVHR